MDMRSLVRMVVPAVLWGCGYASAQPIPESVGAVADTFYRQMDPDATFGEAGALHVGGAESTNASGEEQGTAESWLRFDVGVAVASFDAAFGAGGWEMESAELVVEEVGAPRHPLFARGDGEFEVRWVARDDWSEGTGRPNSGGTASGDALSFNTAQDLLDAATDESLGTFSRSGADRIIELALDPAEGFVADIEAGQEVTLALVPADSDVGLTVHSSRWIMAEGRPQLRLSARAFGDDSDMDGTDNDAGDADDMTSMCGAGLMGPAMIGLSMLMLARLGRSQRMSRRRR